MREVLGDIDRWRADGRKVALARVVGVEGSGPRELGATMAVSEDGEVSGSVSGGCVEAAVVSEALEVLNGPRRPKLCSFGYSDEEAFAVGLTCGGTVHVFVASVDPQVYETLRDCLATDDPVSLATLVEMEGGAEPGAEMLVGPGQPSIGSLGNADLDRVVERDALAVLDSGASALRHYGRRGEARRREVSVFIEAFTGPPRMVIFGAVDFTAALAKVAKLLGYRVTVCDARAVFATPARFPMADEVVVEWPDRYLAEIGSSLGPRDAICVLTHDHRFDVPAIAAALQTRAGYIGAMGSRRTNEQRVARLREQGANEAALARVMGPIGLDIGARTPEETAISICAEIIAFRSGRPAASLAHTEGPIHSPAHPPLDSPLSPPSDSPGDRSRL